MAKTENCPLCGSRGVSHVEAFVEYASCTNGECFLYRSDDNPTYEEWQDRPNNSEEDEKPESLELSKEIVEHFNRIKDLAEAAAESPGESFSSRASAMAALTAIIRDLVKEQEKVANMERLMAVENAVVTVVNEHLTAEQREELLKELAVVLRTVGSDE